MSEYGRQQRGDLSAYERYLGGMDASMKQKVALTAAHLLARGTVADMGMGSGSGSFALASLYPSLAVVGVDINPTMVELAAKRHLLPNLTFRAGDIADSVFPDGSLDGILDSSVLHHVTTFSGYDYDAAARCLENQVKELRPNGVLIVRDFVDPGSQDAVLDLPTGDGDESDDPATCSTARLFERFAREFRKLSPSPGFAYRESEASRPGFRRFHLPLKLASEFVLRKDYRRDWDTEILEEYTYFTQREFERLFARLGLRVLASTPIWNPWIVRNRYEGKFFLDTGLDTGFPPTNYLIAGEKVADGEGVCFDEGPSADPPQFLLMAHFRNRASGALMDLARRPNPTIDVIPWFENDGDLYVLARKSYPRAILGTDVSLATPSLDGSMAVHFVTEPLSVIQRDEPFGTTVVASVAARAAIAQEHIRSVREGWVYYPSPGGIEEEVRSSFVEIEPSFEQTRIANVSGFATSGHVRPIEATQLLRSAQVGGLSDARLEMNVYELLQKLGRPAGPWIGESIVLGGDDAAIDVSRVEDALARPSRRVFAEAKESSGFLEVRSSVFREIAADGDVLASQTLEYVVPATRSINTIATALLARRGGTVCIGLDDDDLPAAQSFTGNSELFVAPAWRVPRELTSRPDVRAWVEERLVREYGVRAANWWELGGKYHPSAGLTPERVFPYAIEVVPEQLGERRLTWLPLADVVRNAGQFRDGHLRVVALRAAHALGLLNAEQREASMEPSGPAC